jgi:hypothetical protein
MFVNLTGKIDFEHQVSYEWQQMIAARYVKYRMEAARLSGLSLARVTRVPGTKALY